MPQETKNIIQLKESTSGPNFYPETHKAAIVGKETYSYLGETVSPGGGGGGSTGGDKPLSVSPRQSVIVGKAIPFHPRKGKKYYFADGIIKVKTATEVGPACTHSCITFYSPNDLENPLGEDVSPTSHCIPNGVYIGWNFSHPVLVTIMEESPSNTAFNLATMAKISFPGNLTTQTESPFIDIRCGKVIVSEIPVPTTEEVSYNWLRQKAYEKIDELTQGDGYSLNNYNIRRLGCQTLTFSGHIIACTYTSCPRTNRAPRREDWKHGLGCISRCWVIKRSVGSIKGKFWTSEKLRDNWYFKPRNFGKTYVYSVRRGRIGKVPYIAFSSKKIIAKYKDNEDTVQDARYPFFKIYKGD